MAECNEHRTINPMSHVTKIIARRARSKIIEQLSEEQLVFKDNSGRRKCYFHTEDVERDA